MMGEARIVMLSEPKFVVKGTTHFFDMKIDEMQWKTIKVSVPWTLVK